MERIALKPTPEPYELTAPAYDDDGTAAPVTGTLAITVYDATDVLVDSGTPTAPAGVLTYSLPNSAIAAAGVYRLMWTGTAGGVARTWETFVEFYDQTAPDYETYTECGGIFDADAFAALLPAAQAAVDEAIWPNTLTTAARAAYERAICAVIGVIESDGILSEQVGRVQYSYASANIRVMAGQTSSPVHAAIRKHLSGTGLLYRGI